VSLCGVAHASAAPHLIEFVDIGIRAIDDVHKSLVRNYNKAGVSLWQRANKSRTVGERNRR